MTSRAKLRLQPLQRALRRFTRQQSATANKRRQCDALCCRCRRSHLKRLALTRCPRMGCWSAQMANQHKMMQMWQTRSSSSSSSNNISNNSITKNSSSSSSIKNSISVCRRNVYWAKISSAFVMLEEVPKDMQNGFESKQWARARMRATCWHQTSKS